MIILNHSLISPIKIIYIDSTNDISSTIPSDFLIIRNLEIAKFCSENNVPYSSEVSTILESLLLVNLGAKFLICDSLEFAIELQKLAESYLFDCKVLLKIQNENEIEHIARHGIDGVIFS